MNEPHETRASRLRRVLPDLDEIGDEIRAALWTDSRFHLKTAIGRTEKLLNDLVAAGEEKEA